jgi:hypothetical protein
MSATAGTSGASSAMWSQKSIVDCATVGPVGRQDEERPGDALPRGWVGLVVRTVDADAGAVVLKHRRHRSGIVGSHDGPPRDMDT